MNDRPKIIGAYRQEPKLKEHVQLQIDVAVEDYINDDISSFSSIPAWFNGLPNDDKLAAWAYMGQVAMKIRVSKDLKQIFNELSKSVNDIFFNNFDEDDEV